MRFKITPLSWSFSWVFTWLLTIKSQYQILGSPPAVFLPKGLYATNNAWPKIKPLSVNLSGQTKLTILILKQIFLHLVTKTTVNFRTQTTWSCLSTESGSRRGTSLFLLTWKSWIAGKEQELWEPSSFCVFTMFQKKAKLLCVYG